MGFLSRVSGSRPCFTYGKRWVDSKATIRLAALCISRTAVFILQPERLRFLYGGTVLRSRRRLWHNSQTSYLIISLNPLPISLFFDNLAASLSTQQTSRLGPDRVRTISAKSPDFRRWLRSRLIQRLCPTKPLPPHVENSNHHSDL